MKKLLHLLTIASAPVLAITLAQPANASLRARSQKSDVFKYAPISKYEQTHNGKALSLDNLKKNIKSNKKKSKIISEEDFDATLPSGYTVGYLDAPDGSTWFYTKDLEYTTEELEGGYATQKVLSGYTFTIYDSSYELVGSFSDKLELAEDETRIGDVQIGACVTQKFFNRDTNYEVMVMIAANTAQYENHYYTKVYSLGSETEGPIETLNDYYSDAINVGTYTEKYYITFCHEGKLPATSVDNYAELGYEADETVYAIRNVVYAPASWSSDKETELKTFCTAYELNEGSGGLPFLSAAYNGSAYFANVYYEKPFFASTSVSIDPETGEMTRNTIPTADNNFVVEVYKTSYSGISLESTTKIPMEIISEDGTNNLFYEMGYLNYNDDLSFGTWTKDDKPSFIVTIENYATSSDESTYAFKVYNTEGKEIATIAENVTSLVDASDISGFEHQQGFYKVINDEEIFEYVDMPSCNVAATFKVALEDNSLTAIADRYPKDNSYQYAFSLSVGMNNDDNSNTDHYIAWFNRDGSFDHNDIVPLGANIAQAYPYIKTSTLNPYLFNTDDHNEYMFLIKTYLLPGISTQTTESLAIFNDEGTVIARLLGDEVLGYLVTIVVVDAKDNPTLWLTYYNDDTDVYTSNFLKLPLTKFEKGGDGSSANPFLISTAGDLQQMKGNLAANYKIVNDIDATKCMFNPIPGEFTGTLDGGNFTISNFSLSSSQYYNGIFQELVGAATIKNIKFKNVDLILTEGNDASGLIASQVRGNGLKSPSISNIHVDDYTVAVSDDSTGSFGGLVGAMYLGASLTDSSIDNASFDINNSNAGGLVGETRTGSIIKNCSFRGWLAGDINVGGILAKATTGDETITNNHVIAEIEGANTIGGIVGYAGRAKIANNYVQGSISASSNDKWGAGAQVGGIVGHLVEDWTSTSTAIVTNNVVALSSIVYPEYGQDEEWLNQSTTAHRIVGYTKYNAEPKSADNPMAADAGIINNYAIENLSVLDSNIAAEANTTEGATLANADLTQSFLTEQGFAFGSNNTSPWLFTENGVFLYYEDTTSAVNDITVSANSLQRVANAFYADGCSLNVYNLYGVKVASGANSVSTHSLTPGVYVVTATQNGKAAAAAKFVIK